MCHNALDSNVSTIAIGSDAANLFDGQGNTLAIINQPGHSSSAALLCQNYQGGGFNDWYFPAYYLALIIYWQKIVQR
jgi:hypothetical protein